MNTLWNVTRQITKVVSVLLGRFTTLEKDVASQEKRINDIEDKEKNNLHSLEVRQQENIEKEESRQDKLTDKELTQELEVKYGTTKWAGNLISRIIRKRGNNNLQH